MGYSKSSFDRLSPSQKRKLWQRINSEDNLVVVINNGNNEKETTFLSQIGVIILSIVVITVAVLWYDLLKATFKKLVPMFTPDHKQTAIRILVIIVIFTTVLLVVLVWLFSSDSRTKNSDLSDTMVIPRVQ